MMSKKQILSLLVGLLFLAGGFLLLANPAGRSSRAAVSASASAQASASAEASAGGTVFDTEQDSSSGLTRGLEWLTSRGIPLWVFIAVFVVILIAVRFLDMRLQVKRYDSRRQAEESAPAQDAEKDDGASSPEAPSEARAGREP